jgi:hypothetical protein
MFSGAVNESFVNSMQPRFTPPPNPNNGAHNSQEFVMPEFSDLTLEDRVKKLEERVDQVLELLQIIPRMDTKQADFGSGPEHAKVVFLNKLAEILEDPSIAPHEHIGS